MHVWIQIPESGEVVVQYSAAHPPVRVVLQPNLHPVVECKHDRFYPAAWHGFISCQGTHTRWEYPSGPVKEVRTREDRNGSWLLVIWK